MTGPASTTGNGFTVKSVVVVETQPVDVTVPVIVYVVLVFGLA